MALLETDANGSLQSLMSLSVCCSTFHARSGSHLRLEIADMKLKIKTKLVLSEAEIMKELNLIELMHDFKS
ncbi:CLUMA_CG005164, isoform A [Clunio marinus]|uniref:CLUMA_CG005164, isoform A n=1 Tax=Clunio marinus TaxID=568069 RepID=A0A1J1HVC2_9DIPT|nr:CLUMA_CG005164, isoform A [Clunio marinus]